ncbi:hypothetical protein PV325_011068 [Microctonus aethiopoides]|nr:hypothetical protein PV325_011068 [Microctonus aethiopoides]
MTCSIQANFCLLVFRMICELRDMAHLHAHLDESTDPDSVIRQCINKYVLLLKYRDSIQNMFGPIILQMFISNALQLCSSLFVISQLKASARNIIFFAAYAITKISESCICAFVGSQLITEYQLVWEQTTDEFGSDSTQSETNESGSLSLYGYLTQHFSIGCDDHTKEKTSSS